MSLTSLGGIGKVAVANAGQTSNNVYVGIKSQKLQNQRGPPIGKVIVANAGQTNNNVSEAGKSTRTSNLVLMLQFGVSLYNLPITFTLWYRLPSFLTHYMPQFPEY